MAEINETQIAWIIGACNQIDARVQMNMETRKLWQRQMAGFTFEQVKDACDRFYDRPWNKDYPRPVIDPASLRREILEHLSRETARGDALTASEWKRPSHKWRDRNPEKWDQMVRAGRDAHREDLQRRGIPLKSWQHLDTLHGPHGPQDKITPKRGPLARSHDDH